MLFDFKSLNSINCINWKENKLKFWTLHLLQRDYILIVRYKFKKVTHQFEGKAGKIKATKIGTLEVLGSKFINMWLKLIYSYNIIYVRNRTWDLKVLRLDYDVAHIHTIGNFAAKLEEQIRKMLRIKKYEGFVVF